jgi:DNA invertase Pin-like site-specific DNA recombinase
MKKAKRPVIEAFGYIRVSGRGQLDGDGFPRQRAAIEAYAAANGYRVVQWFEERAVCGATEWENRPTWSEMMQELNGVQTIIVERVERLARDLGVQEWIFRDLKQRKVSLISATEENLDADPTRVLIRQMFGAIAQYDRAMIILKLRAARKRVKATAGRCEGRKPFGSYPGERGIIERMLALRVAGETFVKIAETLNTGKVPTRVSGGRWFPATVQKILRHAA